MKQRPLRKEQNALSWEETARILGKELQGVLGTHGLDGYPYTVPLNYVLYQDKIIFHTAPEGYLQECLAKNPAVSFTAYNVLEVKETTSNWESAMVFGTAEVITDAADKENFMKILAGKFAGSPPPAFPPDLLQRFAVMVIHIKEFSGKLKEQ